MTRIAGCGLLVGLLTLMTSGHVGALEASNPTSGPSPEVAAPKASGPTLVVSVNSTDGTCAGTQFLISFGWTATVSDPTDGNDVVGMIAYDPNGVAIAADWNGWSVGTTMTETTPFGAGAGINPLTVRPLTIQMYDIVTFPPFGQNTQAIFDDILAQSATSPLMMSMVYDPAADVPDCGSLEELGTPVPTLGPAALVILTGLVVIVGWVVLRRYHL